jgi:hypothetical protein
MQVKAGIATVVNRFKLFPNNRTPVPVTLDPGYFMMSAKGGLWLDFEKRTEN